MKSRRPALRRIRSLFTRTNSASLESIEDTLIQADVGVKYASAIRMKLQEGRGDRVLALRAEIAELLSLSGPELCGLRPSIVLVSGVNGSGKTTTAAKLANL
ncbi:signal recognition particle receptor subunit alpha, partial [candidate division WOR-3 bacterium]|nr:signal recognition particle receptor subunit alpha [candidate division WOR-3 bacterium]